MKSLILLLLFPALLTAQTTETFSISGTIKGLTENAVVTLTNFNDQTDTVARTLVKKGVFNLTGSITEPNLYQVNFHDAQKKFLLFMGNDKITLTGDVAALQNVTVKGSAIHSDFASFQQTFNPLVQRLTGLSQVISARPDIKRDDSLMIQYTAAFDKVKATIDEFVTTKKNSPVAPFVILVTSEIEQDITAVERRFNLLAVAQQQGFYGKILKEQVADSKIGAVGTDALTFVQNDTLGRPISLASFKGKYVLIDFWASWCKPCRLENPNVVAAYNRFKTKNFTVLGVSLDRSKEPWIKAIHDDELKWTHVSDLQFWNNSVAQLYKVGSIPQNFLVGPDGKIVGKNLRGEELHEKLCELLGCDK